MRAWPLAIVLCAAGCVRFDEVDLELASDAAVPDAASPCPNGEACLAPAALEAVCIADQCTVVTCAVGFVDVDGDGSNGCEAPCAPVDAPDVCDAVDSDCDGLVDEDGAGTLEACGGCDVTCTAGPAATPACVDDTCAIAACAPDRFTRDGDLGTGCECDATAWSTARRALPAFEPPPGAVRFAFPGDGGAGVAVWIAGAGDDREVRARPVDVAGFPRGPSDVIGRLGGDATVHDAWLGPTGPVVILRRGDSGQRTWLGVVGGEVETLAENCPDDRCVPVRLPDRGGIVRLEAGAVEFILRRPDGGELLRWARPEGDTASLRTAACQAPDRCLAAYQRNGGRLRLTGAGIDDAELPGVGEIVLTAAPDRWFAMTRDSGRWQMAWLGADDGRVAQLPGEDYGAGAMLPAPDGGVYAIVHQGDRVLGLPYDANLDPRGELRPLPADIWPHALLGPSVFADHERAVTFDRVVWVGLPAPRVDQGVAPTWVPGAGAPWLVFHGEGGTYAMPWSDPLPEPILLMRHTQRPTAPPAALWSAGRLTVIGGDGTTPVRADVSPDGTTQRQPISLEAPEGLGVRPEADFAVVTGGSGPLMAMTGRLSNGAPVMGTGPLGEPLGLFRTVEVESRPRLIAAGSDALLATRIGLAIGVATRLRRIGPGHVAEVGRRPARVAAVARVDGRWLVAWLDTRSDACEGGPTQVRVASLDNALRPRSAGALADDLVECPESIALRSTGDVGHLVVTDRAGTARWLTVDRVGQLIGAPAPFGPVAPAVPIVVEADRPTVAWPEGDAFSTATGACDP